MASSLLLHLFFVCLLTNLFELVLSKTDISGSLIDENPVLQLSIYPNFGPANEQFQVRCEISQPTLRSPLSSTQLDNVFLSVKTDLVKPSGILLMFDDTKDECQKNRDNIQIEICNASTILIYVSHTVLNETIGSIDYSCKKGSVTAMSSYRIKKNLFGRYYDQSYNSSSSLTHTSFLLVLLLFISRLATTASE